MPLSYFVDSNGGSSFSPGFDVLDDALAPLEKQLRVAIDGVEQSFDDGEWSATATPLTVSLPESTTGKVVIWRETRMDRPWSQPTPAAFMRSKSIMAYWNQLLYIFQELRELADLETELGNVVDEEYEPDYSIGEQMVQYDDGGTTLSFEDIELLTGIPGAPSDARHQLVVEYNLVGDTWIPLTYDASPADGTEYSVDSGDTEITIGGSGQSNPVRIRRSTKIDAMWAQFRDGFTLSASQVTVNQKQLRFLFEESPPMPRFNLLSLLGNSIFPRGWNWLVYSGPGDTFSFGGASWGGDGAIVVYVNDVELHEPDDYTLDPIDFEIIFPVPLDEDDVVVIGNRGRWLDHIPNDDEIENPQPDPPEPLQPASITMLIPVTVDANRDLVAETENPQATIVHINPDEVDSKAVFEWLGMDAAAGKDLGVVEIGFRAFESFDPDAEYTTTYKIYAVNADYSTTGEGVTSIEGTFTEEDSWVRTGDISDFIEAALLRNEGNLYLVFTADSPSGLSVNARDHEVDDAEYMGARMSTNGAPFPSPPADELMSGFAMSQFRAGTMGALTLNIDYTFPDVQDGQLPFLSQFNYGIGTGGAYTHNHDLMAFLMTAAGTLTITGYGEVNTDESSDNDALVLLQATPNEGFTQWTRHGVVFASTDDLDSMTSGSGVVPFTLTYTVAAEDVGKYLYLEFHKDGVPAFQGVVTIETVTLE